MNASKGRPAWTLAWLAAAIVLGVLIGRGSKPALPPVEPRAATVLGPELDRLVARLASEVRESPKSAEAHGELGLAYETNELWEEALGSYENASVLDPGEVDWFYRQALSLQMLNRVDDAVSLLRRAVDVDPDFAPAWHQLGHALLDGGELVAAGEAFETLVSLQPDAAEGHIGLGEVRLGEGDSAGAIPHLEKGVSLDDGYKRGHYSLGRAYRAAGRDEDADRELRLGGDVATAAEARPRRLPDELSNRMWELVATAAGHANVAASMLGGGDAHGAAAHLEKVLPLYPGNAKLLVGLGQSYMAIDENERALEAFEQAAESEPRRLSVRYNQARCLQKLGRVDDALACWQQVIEITPDFVSAHMQRAQLLFDSDRAAEGIAALRVATTMAPHDSETHLAIGRAYLNSGRFSEAIAALRRGVEIAPDSLEGHKSLAQAAFEVKDYGTVELALKQMRRISPYDAAVSKTERALAGAGVR